MQKAFNGPQKLGKVVLKKLFKFKVVTKKFFKIKTVLIK